MIVRREDLIKNNVEMQEDDQIERHEEMTKMDGRLDE